MTFVVSGPNSLSNRARGPCPSAREQPGSATPCRVLPRQVSGRPTEASAERDREVDARRTLRNA